jgi:hypothetical protein
VPPAPAGKNSRRSEWAPRSCRGSWSVAGGRPWAAPRRPWKRAPVAGLGVVAGPVRRAIGGRGRSPAAGSGPACNLTHRSPPPHWSLMSRSISSRTASSGRPWSCWKRGILIGAPIACESFPGRRVPGSLECLRRPLDCRATPSPRSCPTVLSQPSAEGHTRSANTRRDHRSIDIQNPPPVTPSDALRCSGATQRRSGQ